MALWRFFPNLSKPIKINPPTFHVVENSREALLCVWCSLIWSISLTNIRAGARIGGPCLFSLLASMDIYTRCMSNDEKNLLESTRWIDYGDYYGFFLCWGTRHLVEYVHLSLLRTKWYLEKSLARFLHCFFPFWIQKLMLPPYAFGVCYIVTKNTIYSVIWLLAILFFELGISRKYIQGSPEHCLPACLISQSSMNDYYCGTKAGFVLPFNAPFPVYQNRAVFSDSLNTL